MKRGLVTFLVIALIAIFAYAIYKMTSYNTSSTNQPTGAELSGNVGDLEVATTNVTYFQDKTGYYASPVKPGDYPGVIMIHEWWGLNDNIKDMARKLSSDGYLVLAVDLFGQSTAEPNTARNLVGSLDQKAAIQNLQAAVDFLKKEGATRLGSLGWCFGGGQSLQLALTGTPLDATVLYYGQLTSSPDQLKNIKWPVLGIFGDKDQSISVDSVNSFQTELNKLGISNEIHIYPGVGHAFANPTGANYAPNETKDAWEKTVAFLKANLQTP